MPLFCQTHTVSITDRGGERILGQLESLTKVQWERVRDDISQATVTVAQPGRDCFQLLNDISANRHEMVVYRGKERVWEGPITHIGRHADTFIITARDIGHYLDRTAMENEYDNSARWVPDSKDPSRVFQDNTGYVVDRVRSIVATEVGRVKETLDPPVNIVQYMTAVRAATLTDERECNRRTLAFSMGVIDEMESLNTYNGLDYTVVGRRLIINDNRVVIGKTAPVTERDFLSEIVVTSYGMDSYTQNITVGEDGMYGTSGGVDPFYGEWQNVEQMGGEDSAEAPSQGELDRFAEMGMSGKLPVPTVVRVPENSRLNPNGTLSIGDLVPGVIIPVRATLTSIVLVQNQRLQNVTVTETGTKGEEITVTLVTAPTTLYDQGAVEVGAP